MLVFIFLYFSVEPCTAFCGVLGNTRKAEYSSRAIEICIEYKKRSEIFHERVSSNLKREGASAGTGKNPKF
jgi:hypothetical protein